MFASKILLSMLLFAQLGTSPASYRREADYQIQDGNPVLDGCLITVKDEVKIPAQEAGVLVTMALREGSKVEEGELLAVVDDREAKAALKVAQYAYEAAVKRAEDDIEERYAKKASDVARVDWEQSVLANQLKKDAVSDIDIRSKQLQWERAVLQIEKAQKDQVLAALDAKTKKAELEAAEMALQWRSIYAPFDGEVTKLHKHQSEWVNPGDTILELVRFDKLYVEGWIKAHDYDRPDLLGHKVIVEVPRARGKKIKVEGKIVYTEGKIRSSNNDYRIRAEIDNKKENGHWLIQPGARARMTILMDE